MELFGIFSGGLFFGSLLFVKIFFVLFLVGVSLLLLVGTFMAIRLVAAGVDFVGLGFLFGVFGLSRFFVFVV